MFELLEALEPVLLTSLFENVFGFKIFLRSKLCPIAPFLTEDEVTALLVESQLNLLTRGYWPPLEMKTCDWFKTDGSRLLGTGVAENGFDNEFYLSVIPLMTLLVS